MGLWVYGSMGLWVCGFMVRYLSYTEEVRRTSEFHRVDPLRTSEVL
jgi:hypothetical protein